MAAASAFGKALNCGLLVVGKTIFWADSWLVTWLLAYECPQVNSTPATTSTTTKSRPAAVASASKVLLRISCSSLHRPGWIGPASGLCLTALSFQPAGGPDSEPSGPSQ